LGSALRLARLGGKELEEEDIVILLI